MTQNQAVLRHLKRGPLTSWVAIHKYRILRVASRIAELRGDGWNIDTEMVSSGKKRYAKYILA